MLAAMHLAQIGVAAAGKGAQEVESGRCLAVGPQHALGIVATCLRAEFDTVDDIAEIARQGYVVLRFGRRTARLGELPCHSPDLDHRHLAGESQHCCHLQDHAEGIADIVRAELGKALGTIAALQQECLARCDLREARFQVACLTGKNERRKAGQHALGFGKLGRVFIKRQVLRGEFVLLPAVGCPVTCHVQNFPMTRGPGFARVPPLQCGGTRHLSPIRPRCKGYIGYRPAAGADVSEFSGKTTTRKP